MIIKSNKGNSDLILILYILITIIIIVVAVNFNCKVEQGTIIDKKYASEISYTEYRIRNDEVIPYQRFISEKYNYSVMDLFTLFQSLYKLKSAQARAFLFFECMWKSRALFSVETTWKRYDNMAILSLQPRRDKNADITEFSITSF